MRLLVHFRWGQSVTSSHPDYLFRRTFSVHANRKAKSTKTILPTTPARTRFAPSPTGYLHLGSLRTALFNYLLAKKTGGQFLLRIEDTDRKRTVKDAEARLCEDLQWAGLQWDEGPGVGGQSGPYRQSERTRLYQEHAQRLVDSGHAYRCFCSAERLDELARSRKELGLPTDYDRQCFGLSSAESEDRASRGENHVIRLLAPDLYPDFMDLIYGKVGKDKGANIGVTYKHGEIAYEDPVLLKTDGSPTYHLANVVDDHHMAITHVVRATEWMSSTPKHLALYEAFGWQPPTFAHVGLLVDEHGHKLSKRNLDTDIGSYRDKYGVLPSAMINFVALLGWSHGQRSDVMDLEKLVDEFQMRFTKGNTTVTLDKLWYLQRAHAARAVVNNNADLNDMVRHVIARAKVASGKAETPDDPSLAPYIRRLVVADARNYESSEQFYERNTCFFIEPSWSSYENPHPDIASTKQLRGALGVLLLVPDNMWKAEIFSAQIKAIISGIAQSSQHTVVQDGMKEEQKLRGLTTKEHEKACTHVIYDYLRWVLLSGHEGPSLASTLEILGPSTCKRRLIASAAFEIHPPASKWSSCQCAIGVEG